LTAVVLDDSSRPLAGADVAWTSREPALATVDSATGKVLAKASGTRATCSATRFRVTAQVRQLPERDHAAQRSSPLDMLGGRG
jgi:uncharacterized protein YjdB